MCQVRRRPPCNCIQTDPRLDCKNTTDDALQNYLTSLKFQQSHFYTDVKLALGYLAVIVSAITFAYDYKLGFDKTKHYTAATVAIYMLLNGAFTYWTYYVEKDVVFKGDFKGRKVGYDSLWVGHVTDQLKIELSSKCTKYDPTYRLTCKYATGSSGPNSSVQEIEVMSKFMRWFTADGFLVAKPFQEWIASMVPLVAEADPNAAKVQDKEQSQVL